GWRESRPSAGPGRSLPKADESTLWRKKRTLDTGVRHRARKVGISSTTARFQEERAPVRPRPGVGHQSRRCDVSADPLRIAVISPVWFPVPPTGYGGIEWIVWLLADGLVDAGHDVTLFASGDSHTKARLASVFETAPSARIGQTLPEL